MRATVLALALAASPAGATMVHTVDSAGVVGRYNSVAIGADGLPVISYYHSDAHELRVAHCNDAACTTASLETASDVGDAGMYSSIAIGGDGLPVIAFYEVNDGALKVAHCSDGACDQVLVYFADPDVEHDVGVGASLAIHTDGYPIIAYVDVTDWVLRIADCISPVCFIPTRTPLVQVGASGGEPAIAIGTNGLPLIAYHDGFTSDLVVVECETADCSSREYHPIDTEGNVGTSPSIAIGADDLGIIAYQDIGMSRTKVAHCNDASCSTASSRTLDEDPGTGSSIAIGPDGLARISYWAQGQGSVVKLASCDDVECSSARVSVLAEAGFVGRFTSIAFDGRGQPVVSFFDSNTGDLRVAYPGIHSDGFESGDLGGWFTSP